jgi:hypothetical protein
MGLNNFLPPDSLIESIPLICSLNLTMNYVDYVQQAPFPVLNKHGIDDVELAGEIDLLQNAILKSFPKVKEAAGIWIDSTSHDVTSILSHFSFFTSKRLGAYYSKIYRNVKKEDIKGLISILTRMKEEAFKGEANAKIVLGALVNFEKAVSLKNKELEGTYQGAKIALSHLTTYTDQIESKIMQLRQKVAENNKKVAETGIKEGTDAITNGIAVASSVATEKYTDAIKTGALMGFNFIKAGVEVIILDQESINLLHEIRELAPKLSKIENDLQVLNNATSELSSLLNTHFFSKLSITIIENYWQELQSYITNIVKALEQSRPEYPEVHDPKEIMDVWNRTIAGPIDKYLDYSIENTDTTPSKWDIESVQFDSLENLGNYTS